ncbi:hypothetical protein B0H11DRAFT_1903791 [Mycena galericulata]|nr:hypothetical protein B0H11DRAFT_1903791 [Mycena galericulata]
MITLLMTKLGLDPRGDNRDATGSNGEHFPPFREFAHKTKAGDRSIRHLQSVHIGSLENKVLALTVELNELRGRLAALARVVDQLGQHVVPRKLAGKLTYLHTSSVSQRGLAPSAGWTPNSGAKLPITEALSLPSSTCTSPQMGGMAPFDPNHPKQFSLLPMCYSPGSQPQTPLAIMKRSSCTTHGGSMLGAKGTPEGIVGPRTMTFGSGHDPLAPEAERELERELEFTHLDSATVGDNQNPPIWGPWENRIPSSPDGTQAYGNDLGSDFTCKWRDWHEHNVEILEKSMIGPQNIEKCLNR